MNLPSATDKNLSRTRIIILGSVIATSIFLLLVRLFSMQVIQAAIYDSRANEVTKRTQVIPTKRGQIFDKNYDVPIASNYDSFVLMLNPFDSSTQETITMLGKLGKRLGVSVESLRKKLPSNLKLYHPVELKSPIKYEDIVYFAEHKEEFPGISWESRPVRSYSQNRSMAHTLGYVGEITPEELQVLYNRGYTEKSIIGKAGIEKTYDNKLRGRDGRRFKRIDASGQGINLNETVDIPPELGKNLVLTLDRHIQNLAERALGKRIGSALVLKPATGEILAMVSYPSYNPNRFYTEQSSQAFTALSQDSHSPFINRNIQSAAPPASTFKILMTSAVLEEKAFPKTSKVFCPGFIQLGNRRFNCHVLTGHGYLDLPNALAQSCNVFFYTMGNEYLGVNKIVDYCYRYGFGEISGIDLPGEVAGLVPTPEWKQETQGVPWVGGDTVNMSIGQGFVLTTPLQLADMVAGIVNGGTIYQPHVLKEVRDSSSYDIIETNQPKILRTLNLRSDTIKDTQDAMRGVITHGTAAPVITTKAVQIAAKTGTSQTGSADDKHSWFAAYAPYNYTDINDVVVVVVWVDAINEWEWWAPKAANIIFQGIFTKKNYEDSVKDLQPLWYLSSPEPYTEDAVNAQ